MTDLVSVIRERANGDPDESARLVVEALHVPRRWADLFWPLLRDECRRQSRAAVRLVEQGTRPTNVAPNTTRITSRGVLLDLSFYNGERYVPYATATVADHEGRIAHQQSLCVGIVADIERHRGYIADIEAAGVTCLGEIDGWADEDAAA